MKFIDLSTTFHTDRIQECKEFYQKHFDVKVTFECDWYLTIQFKSDMNPYIFLSFMTPQEANVPLSTLSNGGVTLNLMVANVDIEYEKLKKAGLKMVDELADQEWGCRAFSVEDPIGNILYLFTEIEMGEKYKNALKQ